MAIDYLIFASAISAYRNYRLLARNAYIALQTQEKHFIWIFK